MSGFPGRDGSSGPDGTLVFLGVAAIIGIIGFLFWRSRSGWDQLG